MGVVTQVAGHQVVNVSTINVHQFRYVLAAQFPASLVGCFSFDCSEHFVEPFGGDENCFHTFDGVLLVEQDFLYPVGLVVDCAES